MNVSSDVFNQAWTVRMSIESGYDGSATGPAVLDLVSSLGGNRQVVIDASVNGKPNIVAAYLLSLLITREGRPQYG